MHWKLQLPSAQCYIDFCFSTFVFTSGSLLRICPSNLIKFSLYGCISPSKTTTHPQISTPPPKNTPLATSLTLQPLQPRFPQPILRQHATNSSLQHLPTPPLPHHSLHIQALQRARPCSLLIIQFLLHLASCGMDICAACGDYVIAAVG